MNRIPALKNSANNSAKKKKIGVCPNGTNTPRGNQFKFFQK